jgi:ribosomal subunit interface protein
MDVRIRATGFELTPMINDYTENKLMSIRHLLGATDTAVRCEVELAKQVGNQRHGDIWSAEINMHDAKGVRYFAREEGESVGAAVDMVKDEILTQVRKHKQVDKGVLRRSGALLKRMLRRE